MNILFYLANGLVLPPAMHFAWNFYKFKGSEICFKRLWISLLILILTTFITGLQFIFPEIIPALDRNREAILSGEFWRLVSPLFIQPFGIWQCVFNGLFFISFVPVAEHLYRKNLLWIYFGAGAIDQVIILYWQTTPGGLVTAGGGSSSALYATMGALYMYVWLNRRLFPKGYPLIPLAGFTGAVVLLFFEDGHAAAVLLGGLFGWLLRAKSRNISAYPQLKQSKAEIIIK